SRRGRRTWANSWVDLRVGESGRRADDALVVAGPGLRFSSAEAKLVASVWDGSDALTGEDATCAAVLDGLGTAGVVHLAAHGTHETDNPLFSSLRLADGPLFAHELDGTDLRGAVGVLSACEVGLSTPRIGGEALGLTSVLLRLGARAVGASVAPLRDDVAARAMPAPHPELRDGAMPGTALGGAVADGPEPVPLVCFGPLVLWARVHGGRGLDHAPSSRTMGVYPRPPVVRRCPQTPSAGRDGPKSHHEVEASAGSESTTSARPRRACD